MVGVVKERKFILMHKQNFYTNVVSKILINSTLPYKGIHTVIHENEV
jgi:hypothetical protein